MPLPPDPTSPDFIAARNAAMAKYDWSGHDDLDPKGPSGHAYGIRVSARLTTQYRRTHRKQAVDVTPQEVTDCLRQADVKDWVLMGLHGYVGYLPQPRATQDVDVMVPYTQKKRAINAIADRWPDLQRRELSQVVRFLDPNDLDSEGRPQAVIDIMLPWGQFQETILKDHVHVDPETGDRIPTVEAAVVAKYAAIVSPHRDLAKREHDAGDLRKMIVANHTNLDRNTLRTLAAQVWEGGENDIDRFIDRAITKKPFPI